MAQARKYTKYIEIWGVVPEEDGYGGQIVGEPELIKSMWANVTAKRSNRLNENGQNDNFTQTVFTVRNRYDFDISIKDNFIKYNGLIYNIDSILNKDLDNIDAEILATQRGNFNNAIEPSL